MIALVLTAVSESKPTRGDVLLLREGCWYVARPSCTEAAWETEDNYFAMQDDDRWMQLPSPESVGR